MNMLTNLKALLFSSAAVRTPMEGAVISSAPQAGAPDFAQLLEGSIVDAGQGVPVPVADAAQLVPTKAVDPAAVPSVKAEPGAQAVWRNGDSPLPPGLALGLLKHAGGKQASSSNGRAGAVADVALPQEGAIETPEPMEEMTAPEIVHAEPVKAPRRGEAVPKDIRVTQKAEAKAEADEPESGKTEEKADRVDPTVATEPLPVPLMPYPALETVPTPVQASAAESDVKTPRPAVQPRSVAESLPSKQAPQVASGHVPDNVVPQRQTEANPGIKTRGHDAAGPSTDPLVATDDPLPAMPDAPAAPVLNDKPVKAEALALLQIVRDQVAARQSGEPVRVGEQVSAAAKTRHEPSAPMAGAPAAVEALPQDIPSQLGPAAPSQPVATQVSAPAAPVADLSASLGTQVVDMGVSGQWIDGLARDIAGLSANGAQGRFQINAHQLGTVQVDIRQGSDGAAVNLTVASEAAEMALRQDSDRLKLDASLSAVRIAEVKIERAAPVAEAARADAAGQQSSQQQSQHSSSHASAAWANGHQDMSQPQGQQGRWQARQNNGPDPKSPADPAVLNHAEARQDASETARARYA